MANFPTSVPTVNQLHTGVNNLRTNLNGAIDAIQATITVVSTTGFPSVGAITIDAERISYTGLNATQFTGCTRGFGSTGAILHLDGAVVSLTIGAEYHNDMRDEVIAIAQNLSDRIGLSTAQNIAPVGAIGAPSFTFLGHLNSGLYHGSTTVNIVVAGNIGLSLAPSSINSNFLHRFADGTNTAPSISFINEGSFNTGIYRVAEGNMGFTANGVLTCSVVASQVQAINGSLAAPSYSFIGDPDTGIYRRASDSLGLVRNGAIGLVIDSFGTICKAGQLGAQNGTAAAPGITFENDLNTGIYTAGTDQLNLVAGGGTFLKGVPNQVQVQDGSATIPAYSFLNDTNSGLTRDTADQVIGVAGGVQALKWDASTTAGRVRLQVYDVDNGGMEAVTVGAADSGGAGYKVLRIPN